MTDKISPEKRAKSIPKPQGYRILIAIPQVDEKTEGGIIKYTSESKKKEEVATVLGKVLELGSDAYADKNRFPSGPWCKAGDWVIIRPYSGTRIEVYGQEFRIVNDDTIEGVVEAPKGVNRAV